MLIAQRDASGSGAYEWEFPGGKVEPGETAEQALVREIREELSLEIRTIEKMGVSEFQYPGKKISLSGYLCQRIAGEIVLTEHLAFKWVTPEELGSYPLSSADLPFIAMILERL